MKQDIEIAREARIRPIAEIAKLLGIPGLPNIPSAEKIDIDSEGRISGLF